METTVQTRNLKMHPHLLMDVIKRQAGTLEKGILEGVMNGIEAGAPSIDITLRNIPVDQNPNTIKYKLNISDQGQGISSRQQIIEYFETFGTPHTESENVIWKQFRMGRGQLFAFGKNTWRTSTFKMIVDIKNRGLDYDLEENLPFVQGCHIEIELYENPILYTRMEEFQKSLGKLVKFMPVPINFNGFQINTNPESCSWDFEDENAYYKFDYKSGVLPMAVYNMGAYVMDIPSSKTGMAGYVVSKKRLVVNFARNDVISTCPVFKSIQDVIRQNRKIERHTERRVLSDSARIVALKDFVEGLEDYSKICLLKLLPTAQGKRISLDEIRRSKLSWTFSPEGDRFADKMCQAGIALCFDESILDDMGYNGHKSEFFTWLFSEYNKIASYHPWQESLDRMEKLYMDFNKIRSIKGGDQNLYTIIPDTKLGVVYRRLLKVLNSYTVWNSRVIRIGFSNTADAWTDGKTYIVINKEYLDRLFFWSVEDVYKLFAVLTHEMAHDDETAMTHSHGDAFYENFYEIAMQSYSPMCHVANFYKRLKGSRVEIQRDKERTKMENAKKALEESLQNGTPKKGRGRPRKVDVGAQI